MAHKFWYIVATTPWWIYLLFFSLIRFSLILTKPRIVSLKTHYLSFFSLFVFLGIACYVFPPKVEGLFLTFPSFIAGGVFALLITRISKVKAIVNEHKIFLPGSWWLLFFILAIFFVRQTLYFYYDQFDWVNWIKLYGPIYLLPLYGFSVGANLTQLIYYRRILKKGPYATEKELERFKTASFAMGQT